MGLRFKSFKYFACVFLRPRCEAIVERHAWLADWIASYCQDTWQLSRLPSAKFRACRTFLVDKSCRNTLLFVCPRHNPVLSRLLSAIKTVAYSDFRALVVETDSLFFHSYFKHYDVTIISLLEHSTSFPTGNAKISRNFFFIFVLGEEKGTNILACWTSLWESNIADFSPAL